MHGGKSPGAKERAEERLADQAADTTVRKLWPGLASMAPVKDPLDLLARTAAAIEHLTNAVGEKVNDLDHLGAGPHLSQLRAEVLLLERLLARLTQAGSEMAKLNIFEKQAALRDRDADLVVGAFTAALEFDLAKHGEAALTVGQQQLLLVAFLGGIGRPQQPLELEGPAAGDGAA